MQKIKLIGLTGRKQSGKDTVCLLLGEFSRIPILRRAFADPLKKEAANALGVSLSEIEGNKELYRPALQWWGTEFRRRTDPQYWINKMPPISFGFLTIVTDVRFQNEADYITNNGGVMVRVERPIERTEQTDRHASETQIDEMIVDHVIKNGGALADLRKSVESLFLKGIA